MQCAKLSNPTVVFCVRWWWATFGFEFHAGVAGRFQDHNAGQLLGFKAEGFAATRLVRIPGDEEVFALKTVDGRVVRISFLHCW